MKPIPVDATFVYKPKAFSKGDVLLTKVLIVVHIARWSCFRFVEGWTDWVGAGVARFNNPFYRLFIGRSQPMLLLHTLCAKFGSLILKLIHWSSEDGLDVELVTRLAMEDFINVLKGSRHKPQNIFTKVNLKQMALEARQHNLLIEHLNICRWYFAPKPLTRSGISHPKVK